MSSRTPSREPTRVRTVPELGGMDVLHAAHGRRDFPRHLHETFTLGTIESGAVVNRSGGATVRLGPGSIYAFDPGEVHDGRSLDGASVAQSTFYPSENALTELAADAGLVGPPRFGALGVHAPRTTVALSALRRTLETSGIRLEREAAIARTFAAVLVEHALLRPGERRVGREPDGVRRAREYLEAHLVDDVSIGELADVAGLSPGYLSRAFRRATGLPPHAWLVQRRVERAKKMIRSGRALVDVAAAVGFVDQSHLNLHFKRAVGVTAGRYGEGRFLPRRAPG